MSADLVRSRLAQVLVVAVLAATPSVLVYLGIAPPVLGLLSIGVPIVFLFWCLERRFESVLLVFVAALLALTIAGQPLPTIFVEGDDHEGLARLRMNWKAGAGFDERLPVVVHLIFDEMTSPGALDGDVPGGGAARQALHAVADRSQVRVFDSVYSRYFFSGIAIPNLVHREYLGRTGPTNQSARLRETIRDNAYFEAMETRGYRTVVFQTTHLNFCAHRTVDHCETIASFDPGDSRTGEPEGRAHTRELWSTLLRVYEPSYVSRYGLDLVATWYPLEPRHQEALGVEGRYDVQRFPRWFDRFIGFIEDVPRGTHVFAHFMAPHAPYLLNEACEIGGRPAAGYYLGQRFPGADERQAARDRFFADYLAQVRCVQRKLDAFFGAVARNPNLYDATIIIHGDHGSRISVGNMIEDYTRRDFIDNYATYFAVKAPGIAPGIDCEFQSLPEAFRRVVPGSDGLAPLDRTRLPVVVNTKAGEGVRVEAEMPIFGCAAGPQ